MSKQWFPPRQTGAAFAVRSTSRATGRAAVGLYGGDQSTTALALLKTLPDTVEREMVLQLTLGQAR
jgi:hypothetical protein